MAAQVAVVVAVIALVSLPIQSANQPRVSSPTSSTASGTTPVFASGVAADGLQLKMTLNATSMRPDGAITGNVTVVNTSNQNATVSTLGESQNITEWSNYDNVCPSDFFMGYALFEGHLTARNVSSAATPVRLAPLMNLQCGAGGSGPGAVTFLPNPDQAMGRVVDQAEPSYLVRDQLNVTTLFCNVTESSAESFACNWATPGIVGYWNWSIPNAGNPGFTSPAFVRFSPGEYTIVAWDDWGQFVYATFVVQPTIGTSSSSADSGVTTTINCNGPDTYCGPYVLLLNT